MLLAEIFDGEIFECFGNSSCIFVLLKTTGPACFFKKTLDINNCNIFTNRYNCSKLRKWYHGYQ